MNNKNHDVEYATTRLTQDQAELLEMLSRECDEANSILESVVDNAVDMLLFESTNINEGMYEVKDKLSKAWKAVVEFFKKCARYIKEKLQGKVHDLNLRYVEGEKNEDAKIEFYTKMKKFKTMEINKNDKLEIVDVEFCYGKLKSLLENVKSTNFDESQNGITDLEKQGSGEIYADVRENLTNSVSGSSESEIKDLIGKINKNYQRAIDAIYKVSASAIKKEKKRPGSKTYKLYLIAKNISAKCLNASTLIKIKD